MNAQMSQDYINVTIIWQKQKNYIKIRITLNKIEKYARIRLKDPYLLFLAGLDRETKTNTGIFYSH